MPFWMLISFSSICIKSLRKAFQKANKIMKIFWESQINKKTWSKKLPIITHMFNSKMRTCKLTRFRQHKKIVIIIIPLQSINNVFKIIKINNNLPSAKWKEKTQLNLRRIPQTMLLFNKYSHPCLIQKILLMKNTRKTENRSQAYKIITMF
jgi:hypothetical protein